MVYIKSKPEAIIEFIKSAEWIGGKEFLIQITFFSIYQESFTHTNNPSDSSPIHGSATTTVGPQFNTNEKQLIKFYPLNEAIPFGQEDR